ncbi:uncharacterized protein LOC116342388 [Contarinia nasturtii]|uniref:uncharacterized protein LOC116342388 n=1 Tax=Contarinia nasturtii TaxID=265458 RepID=UPI0012D476E8|nr:uncharacterized protein LOC116342388 [Contarinia nasturtii]
MDEAINFLNVEIGVFLRYLRCFSKIENVQINKKTIELFEEAKLNIKQLTQGAQIIENSARNDVDFLFDLNEHQYELQRHILCRSCFDMFPLSKHDFVMHLKRKHCTATSTGSNSFSSDFFPDSESTTYHFNGHSKTPSPQMDAGKNSSFGGSHHLSCTFSDNGFVEDSNIAQNNISNNAYPRYSDILRTAPPPQDPEENVVNIKPIDTFMTLGDLIRTDRCFEAISLEMTDFMTQTDQRFQSEMKILNLLKYVVNSFDSALKVLPFGSVEYGFSGANTNYNILIDTRKTEKAPALLLRTFQKFFMSTEAQRYFDFPEKINSNRVLKQQLKMTHKESRIECLLLFDCDISVAKATEIIKDFIAVKPICRQLIAYVRAWQNVVNRLAIQHGEAVFQFNTYIIAVLVIFFMQVHYDLPTVSEISTLAASGKITSTPKSILEEQKIFGKILFEFFHFYGARYEVNNHLVSARIGRWQEQRLTQQQKYFTPEQKRLRDGMTSNSANWQKCTMFVQDLISPELNITAEISKEKAYNFQEMCQMFSTTQRSSLVKRIKKESPQVNYQPLHRTISQNSLPSVKSVPSNRVKTTKEDKNKASTLMASKKIATKKGCPKNPLATLDEVIKNGKIYEAITNELAISSLRSEEKLRHEGRILGMLKQHFKLFDRTLALIPFGSTTYGFAGSSLNYNILVDTRKSKQIHSNVLESFEKYLTKTDIQLHFDDIAEIPASRVLKQQLRMIHKESGIHVLLLADDVTVADTSKIIRDFIAIKPICRNLIECIISWRDALNSILAQSGATPFQFNTHMISVLVIFFMQVNYELGTVQEISTIRSNPETMKKADISLKKDLAIFDKILADFFWFYGQRYQIWNHVISLNIGRWQERRIQDQQKWFLPNQKRLRDGINTNPANWKNCTMFVEDVTRSGINVAAEITAKDSYGFQEMCQIFAKKNICHKICHKDQED